MNRRPVSRPVTPGRLLTAVVMGALAACQPRPAAVDPEDPTIVAAIDSIMREVMEGAAAADADRVLAAAEGEGEFTFVSGDVALTGLPAIRERFRRTYAMIERQSNVVDERRIRVLSPDVAVLYAVGEGTYTDKAGWSSEPVGLGYTIVFVREQGQWRMRHAHQSVAP
ncbi:MAG TPA: SgcJ/EcaC family oxidoreductase [Gemmatimonadales bacterium]|nr:SgcJ/EcaC family oxidoreductase [Gemmatimonadales bacterium]